MNTRQRSLYGYAMIAASIGMMFSLMGPEMAKLESARDLLSMHFVGTTLTQLGSVLTAVAGGQLLPTWKKLKGDAPKEEA